MNIKQLSSLAALLLCVNVASADNVTPEDVKAIKAGTVFTCEAAGIFHHPDEAKPVHSNRATEVGLIKTKTGFKYTHLHSGRKGGVQTVNIEDSAVFKSAGNGVATISTNLVNGQPIRFEWITKDVIKFEFWYSKEAMAGISRNKPATAGCYLVLGALE